LTVQGKLGYVPALDGIRAVAIVLVLSDHLFGIPRGGQVGVDLFFALSGFLITTLLLEERAATGTVSLRGFYARRSRRLFPALGALLTTYLLWDAAHGVNGLANVAMGGLYFANFVEAFVSPNPVFYTGLDHLWSLAQEEQFYLVWPLVLLALAKTRRPAAWTAGIAVTMVIYRSSLVLSGASFTRIYRGPDTRAVGLILGALLAIVLLRRPIRVPEWFAQLSVLAFGLLASVGSLGLWWWIYGQPLVELACVAVVASALSAPGLIQVLSVRPLVWLGRISYSLYLWHWPIFWAMHGRYPLIALALSLVAAWLSYRYVEQPFRRRRRVRAPDAVVTPAPARA
jgi:peptidoglycan/LPS O-acetylase OafA/YrhL